VVVALRDANPSPWQFAVGKLSAETRSTLTFIHNLLVPFRLSAEVSKNRRRRVPFSDLDGGNCTSYIMDMGSIGWQEILLILVIVLLLFGAKRLPEIGRAIGKGIKEFKEGLREIDKDEEKK